MVYLDDMVNWRASLNTMFDDYKTLFPFMRGKSLSDYLVYHNEKQWEEDVERVEGPLNAPEELWDTILKLDALALSIPAPNPFRKILGSGRFALALSPYGSFLDLDLCLLNRIGTCLLWILYPRMAVDLVMGMVAPQLMLMMRRNYAGL